jgi:diguanylate cyclase (GGDEF)-like protein
MAGKNQSRARILIADDEPHIRSLLRELLEDDYECREVDSGEQALAVLRSDGFDIVLSDILMGGISGLDLIPRVREFAPEAVVVVISGEQTIDNAIRAMRAGAFDYITKPFDLDHVEAAVRRALEHGELLASKRRYATYLEKLIKRRTAEVNHLSTHDALTQLPNRALFNDRLAQSLRSACDGDRISSVLVIDIDRFKRLNDTFGPAAGDYLLREVAERLAGCAPEGDSAARLGGDEFALLLTRLRHPAEAITAARRVLDSLRQPFEFEGQELFITCSIGISLCPSDARDPQTMIQRAGTALHKAKEEGGDLFRLYSDDISAHAAKRLMLESRLRQAVGRGEFTLHYQPQVDARNGKIVGVEALVRWDSPELGFLPPGEFIQLAEETGLIMPIGEWALRAACLQLKAWHDAGCGPLRVAVNLSPRQLRHGNLPTMVREALDESGLDPQCLELELTESSLMEDAKGAVATLAELRGMKVRIAIDDFGTGYSSLSYLNQFPIDTLKIDRSFVSDARSRTAAITTAIITLGHALGLRVQAEGVETEDQRAFLCALGCDEMQGYLFGKPLAVEEIAPLLLGGEGSERGRPGPSHWRMPQAAVLFREGRVPKSSCQTSR